MTTPEGPTPADQVRWALRYIKERYGNRDSAIYRELQAKKAEREKKAATNK